MNEDELKETWLSQYIERNGVSKAEAFLLPPLCVFGIAVIGLVLYYLALYVRDEYAVHLAEASESDVRSAINLILVLPLFAVGYLIRTLANVASTQYDSNLEIMQYMFILSVFAAGYLIWAYAI